MRQLDGISLELLKHFESKPFAPNNYGDSLMDKNLGSSYFLESEMPMKPITEGRTGLEASRVEQKHCGRCGVGMKKNEFCLACRKFFQVLNGRTAKLFNFKLIRNGKPGEAND
jgi:hypothetical protein